MPESGSIVRKNDCNAEMLPADPPSPTIGSEAEACGSTAFRPLAGVPLAGLARAGLPLRDFRLRLTPWAARQPCPPVISLQSQSNTASARLLGNR